MHSPAAFSPLSGHHYSTDFRGFGRPGTCLHLPLHIISSLSPVLQFSCEEMLESMTGENVEEQPMNVGKMSSLIWSKMLCSLSLEAGFLQRACFVLQCSVCSCEYCSDGRLHQRVVVLQECDSPQFLEVLLPCYHTQK